MQEALKNEEKIFTLTAKGEKERRQLERQSISEKQKYFFSIKFIIKKTFFARHKTLEELQFYFNPQKTFQSIIEKEKKIFTTE